MSTNMATLKSPSFTALGLGLALGLSLLGCPAAQGDEEASETSGETGAPVCDPQGANPEMGELLNAPLADDVELIVKTPQHPGEPGPDNLP